MRKQTHPKIQFYIGVYVTTVKKNILLYSTRPIVYGTSGIPQDSFMTILLLYGMFGVPTSRLTSILAVDWLINQVDSVCKTLTDLTAVAVVAHLAQGNSVSTKTLANVGL